MCGVDAVQWSIIRHSKQGNHLCWDLALVGDLRFLLVILFSNKNLWVFMFPQFLNDEPKHRKSWFCCFQFDFRYFFKLGKLTNFVCDSAMKRLWYWQLPKVISKVWSYCWLLEHHLIFKTRFLSWMCMWLTLLLRVFVCVCDSFALLFFGQATDWLTHL